MERWLVEKKQDAEFFNKFVLSEVEAGRGRLYTIVRANRSNKQNNTLHLLFRQLAEALNEAGFEIPHPFKRDLEIPYTEHSVKDLLYRPIVESLYGESSSAKLDAQQMSESMDILVDAVNRNTGVLVQVPTQELDNGPR
jgi:hypothetical protein